MVLISLLTSILLATAAFAAPSSMRSRRQSRPLQRLQSSGNDTSNVQYSSNWAGAVWSEAAGTFKAVTGTITVPTPSSPSGSSSAWVGIDGDTCGNAILQTGIDMTYENGVVSYDAWYEWYPAVAHDFTGITIHGGDVLVFTVTATSTTTGIAKIQNLSNGQTVSKSLSSTHALCEQDAEWIVEDYEENGGLVPFCDFGSVDFTNAFATTSSGSQMTPSGATEIDIKQNNVVLTSVSESSSGVTITYK
ncbi:hypothetical protein APHAL10511_004072 [Amanita phalloides]|nr:hypothetical protein APHAL10511_004072 [Amanita phalloides]